MVRDFTADDEGKEVVTADGDTVGTIHETDGSMAHIQPDDDLSRSIRRRLGWTEEGEEVYELDKSKVDRFDGEAVRLKRNL